MNVLNQRMHAAITTKDFFVPSDTAGIELHLRRKRLAQVEKFPAERTLLIMHGATFSSGSWSFLRKIVGKRLTRLSNSPGKISRHRWRPKHSR
jgi:hypothetical protein